MHRADPVDPVDVLDHALPRFDHGLGGGLQRAFLLRAGGGITGRVQASASPGLREHRLNTGGSGVDGTSPPRSVVPL